MLDVTVEFEFELHEVWTEKSTVAAAGAGAGRRQAWCQELLRMVNSCLFLATFGMQHVCTGCMH